MQQIKDTRLFLFDMDGTLLLGDRLFDFTKELLADIRRVGKRYLFLTNNSSKSVMSYVEKLARLGIESSPDDLLTSSEATARYLCEKHKDDRLYVCGTESFKEELIRNGLSLTESTEDADCVVMGFDTELTFNKLRDVSRMLNARDIPYIATNPDYVCPTEYGNVPDCGSVCDMIYNATGKRPYVIGKPSPLMIKLAMEKAGCTPDETAVVGDRIYTDIKSGLNAGVLSVLVMSGETTFGILEKSAEKPDLVLKDAGEIMKYL